MKIHPNEETLEELLMFLGKDQERLIRHLVWCASCRSKLVYLPRPRPVEEAAPTQEIMIPEIRQAVLERQTALQRERDQAPGLFLELLEQPADRRDLLVSGDPRFHTWGVFELLVERSLESSLQDPAFGEHLGLLALRLSDQLDPERYGTERIQDLRARAWAFMGNACRLRFDFQAAEEAFGRAYSLLKKGTRDGVERAIFLDLKASLRRDQRQFNDALRLIRQAVKLFLSYGERHRAGRSLVKQATIHYHAGNLEAAIPLLDQALSLIDAERDPRLLLCARHNLIAYTVGIGRYIEAQRLYQNTRPLYRSFNDPYIQNRRKWLKGQIVRGLNQIRQAESLFTAARDGFMAEGIPYDTALVSLELAQIYAEEGRTEELKRISAEMVPIFASRHIHREALAALTFFRQAVEAENATVEMIANVAAYLRRAEGNPELRFGEGEEAK